MNVVLIGMMGVGKTSVGRRLSELTGRRFIDTDAVIESAHGDITEIFDRFGQAYFRDLETQLVRGLRGESGLVVSTGGGLVTKRESAELLKECGTVIYLRATPKTLLTRIKGDNRPLLKRGEEMEPRVNRLLSERTPIYEGMADIIIDTDGKSIDETAEDILLALKERK